MTFRVTLTVVIGALLASASAHAEPRGRWRWRGREREQRRVDVNSKFQHKLQLTERIAKQVESSGRGYPTSEQLGKLGSHVFGMLALAGIAGTFAGARLGQRVKPEQLRALFAVFVIGLALVLLADNVSKLLTI